MALPQPDRMSGDVPPAYVRHKPEQTRLYQLVERYWPELSARSVKPATADGEADGREEPNPREGKRKGLCCTKRPPRQEAQASVQWGRPGIDVIVCTGCGGPMKTARPG